jgi:hypothetical protein
MEWRAPRAFVFRSMRPAMIFLQKATKKTKAWRLLTRQNKATNSSASSLRYLRFLLFKFRTPRAIDIPEGFLQKATKKTNVKFSASKQSLGYLRFVLLARIRRGALDDPQAPRHRRAPPSMTKQSTAVQVFCHSFFIPVYPPWRVIRASSFLFIRVIRGFKIKLPRKY